MKRPQLPVIFSSVVNYRAHTCTNATSPLTQERIILAEGYNIFITLNHSAKKFCAFITKVNGTCCATITQILHFAISYVPFPYWIWKKIYKSQMYHSDCAKRFYILLQKSIFISHCLISWFFFVTILFLLLNLNVV